MVPFRYILPLDQAIRRTFFKFRKCQKRLHFMLFASHRNGMAHLSILLVFWQSKMFFNHFLNYWQLLFTTVKDSFFFKIDKFLNKQLVIPWVFDMPSADGVFLVLCKNAKKMIQKRSSKNVQKRSHSYSKKHYLRMENLEIIWNILGFVQHI